MRPPGRVECKITHRLGAEIDEEIVDNAAVDLVIGQDVALVLIGQRGGDLGRQLGVVLHKNFLCQLRNQLHITGLGNLFECRVHSNSFW